MAHGQGGMDGRDIPRTRVSVAFGGMVPFIPGAFPAAWHLSKCGLPGVARHPEWLFFQFRDFHRLPCRDTAHLERFLPGGPRLLSMRACPDW